MKKLLLICLVATIGMAAYGQADIVYETPFMPQSPEIMAQGGSFGANAQGFYSLFTNPAAFGRTKPSLTVLSTMPWLYAGIDEATIESLMGVDTGNITGAIGDLSDILSGPGIGFGFSSGLGYVGNSIGLGAVAVTDVFASGPNALGLEVDSNFTLGFIGGFGMPLNLGGMVLHVGGSLRPMYRLSIPGLGIDEFASLMTADFSDPAAIVLPAFYGVGLGIDLGAILEVGALSASLVLRDFGGTAFQYSVGTLGAVVDALSAGSLPQAGDPTPEGVKYVIPMSANIGVAFHPDLGGLSRLIDPIVHGEYNLPFMPIDEAPSFWSSMHLGAEVKLLSILKLRAGINQGYITAGAGLHLLFLDVNVAYFGRELGSFAGAKQSQGVTAEVALRF